MTITKSYNLVVIFRGIFNYLGLQGGWLACVWGAAEGQPWLGPLVVAGYLTVHLWLSNRWQSELQFILLAGLLGTAVDSLEKASGLLVFVSDIPGWPWLAPVWIIAMWLLFASSLTTSLAWLQKRYGLAALLGIIFGPLSYALGQQLGGVTFTYSFNTTMLALAFIWGLVMPGLVWLVGQVINNGEKTDVI